MSLLGCVCCMIAQICDQSNADWLYDALCSLLENLCLALNCRPPASDAVTASATGEFSTDVVVVRCTRIESQIDVYIVDVRRSSK